MNREDFAGLVDFQQNPYHPLTWIRGRPEIGRNVYIGFFSIINAKDSTIKIGDDCDIAPNVSINCADSHKKCIGLQGHIDRKPIIIEHNVFIGTQSIIKPGAHIGHHSVIGAGTVVEPGKIPPYSLVTGNPGVVKKAYYAKRCKK